MRQPRTVKVIYDKTKPRSRGLRLVPGINEIPENAAKHLIARGIVKEARRTSSTRKRTEGWMKPRKEEPTEEEVKREEEGS